MARYGSDSPIATILGITVCAIAVLGTVFLDWTWSNPDGKLLPFAIGIVAAAAGLLFMYNAKWR